MGLAERALEIAAGVVSRSAGLSARTCRGLTIFTVHDVTDQPSTFQKEAGIATPTGTFRSQMEWIGRAFEIVPLEIVGRTALPRSAAAITFDDAWLGTFENGFSVLDEMGIPATTFVNFCGIDEGVDLAALNSFLHGPNAAFPTLNDQDLTPDDRDQFEHYQGMLAKARDLEEWDGHPLFSFGSHLYWHAVSLGSTREAFAESFNRNEERLDTLRRRTDLVSFPFGQPGDHFDDTHVRWCRELGARLAFSARSSVNRGPLGFVLDRCSLPTDSGNASAILKGIHHRTLVEWVRAGAVRSSA